MDIKNALKDRRDKLTGIKISISPADDDADPLKALLGDSVNPDDQGDVQDPLAKLLGDSDKSSDPADNDKVGLAPSLDSDPMSEKNAQGMGDGASSDQKSEMDQLVQQLLKSQDTDKLKGMLASGQSPKGLDGKASLDMLKSTMK